MWCSRATCVVVWIPNWTLHRIDLHVHSLEGSWKKVGARRYRGATMSLSFSSQLQHKARFVTSVSNALMTSSFLFRAASSRTLLPDGVRSSGSAPAARSASTVSDPPQRTAIASAVHPPFPGAEWGAPYLSSSLITSTSLDDAAAWRHELVIPISRLPRDGSAPFRSSNSAIGRLMPPRSSSKSSARCSAVRCSLSRTFGSAWNSSSSSTIAAFGSSASSAM
mmetsp:Transcript_40809/g.87048  ORF Transcript_40809/g.87048 Transcript_40809/m.87048 type:complete len:222 (-) Transcript_40809:936-1601(-)